MWPFTNSKQSLEAPPAEPVEAKALGDDPDIFAILAGYTPGASMVSASQALTVPAVQSAIRVIAEAAASLDIKVMRGSGEVDHPASQLLNGDVNDWMDGFSFIRDLVAEALTNDAGGFAWVNRQDGEPVELIKYDSGAIGVEYATDGTGEPTYRLGGKPLPSRDVVHLRGAFSRCPLTLARKAISAAAHMESHATNLFARGAKPGGLLESPKPIGDKGVAAMAAAWKATMEGGENAGRTGILWDGTTFKPLTLNSTDSQFLENRKFQILEIARAFRVPPSMLFELDRATWSNSEQMGREFLVYSLEPWLQALEGALSRALLSPEERRTHRIRFERDDLTRASINDRATAYSSMIASRVINPNEARQWESLPPYDGGNEYANPNTGSNQPGAAAPQQREAA